MDTMCVRRARCRQNAVRDYLPMPKSETVKSKLFESTVHRMSGSARAGRDLPQGVGTWLVVTLWGIGALLVLHLVGQYVVRMVGTDSVFVNELVWRFNVDLELNVPTWYSSLLAAVGAMSAFFVASRYRVEGAKRQTVFIWLLIAVTLLLISIGETAAIHELVLQTLHIGAKLGEAQSYSANAWLLILPLIGIALVAGLRLLFLHVPRRTFFNLAVAVGFYLLGAVVVEYLSIPVSDQTHLYNFVLTPIEEGLEMIGLWLVSAGIWVHVLTQMPVTNTLVRNLWRNN
jgi:hypothetical protein